MQSIIIRWLINAVAIGAASILIDDIIFNRYTDLLIASALFGILNVSIKPLLLILTLPLNLLTLGLFTLIINTALLGLTAYFLPGFVILSFWGAFFGAIIISLVSIAMNMMLKEKKSR